MTRGRLIAWAILLALLLGACGIYASLPALDAAPMLRVALYAVIGLVGLGLTLLLPRDGKSEKRVIWLILVGGGLARLVLLPAATSDDLPRYIWEGKLVRNGINPYAQVADDPALIAYRDRDWAAMNHRDRLTAYPPLALLVFAGMGALASHAWFFKSVFTVVDFATLLILIALLRQRKSPTRLAALYAFNPVALIGIAAEGHYDSLFVLALTAAWWASQKNRFVLAWIALAVSVQFKIVSAALLPLFLYRKNWREGWVALLVLALPCLPFLSALDGLTRGVLGFGGSGRFNGPAFLLLENTGIPGLPVAVGLIAIAVICLRRWRGGSDFLASSFQMLGAILVLSPIVHFWYLLWLLPLACLTPSPAWLLLCLSQAGYFVAWRTLHLEGWWGFQPSFALLLWSPFYLVGAARWIRWKKAVAPA